MFRIPLKFHIEKFLIVFKSRLANWILVILKVHPLFVFCPDMTEKIVDWDVKPQPKQKNLFFYDFSLISKVSINIHGQGCKIICISNHYIKLLCI